MFIVFSHEIFSRKQKRARKYPCRLFPYVFASRQVISMVIPNAFHNSLYCARCVLLFFFVFCNDIGIVGSGFLVFLLNRAVTHRPGVPPFARPAARRPVHIKPWQKLVNQYHNAHHCNPSTVLGASDPRAAHGQRGRFNCRAAFAAALAVMHNGIVQPILVLPLCCRTNHCKCLFGVYLYRYFPGTLPLPLLR